MTIEMLASRGLVPKLFWWTSPDVLSILEGARECTWFAGSAADEAMAVAIRGHGGGADAARHGAATNTASTASTLKKVWAVGAERVHCEVCSAMVRRSGMARHRKYSCGNGD